MNHSLPFSILLPILLPMFAGGLLVAMPLRWLRVQRTLSTAVALLLLPVAACMVLEAATGAIPVYHVGNWPAPFGIVLQLDRLGALMLLLTAVLGAAAVVAAGRGDARMGRHFHALFQFQLMGLNGAFLAGDLFNLFVFFEILLIASYALLVHGGGRARIGAGLHYVLLNLAGSAFFLIAIGVLYGLSGTLNMAHMGLRLAGLPPADVPLATAAGAMLMLVFGLKAALFPMLFWLPKAYASATGSAAALFAIMTKVGIYAILRCAALIFGAPDGMLAAFLHDWVWWMALATMGFGALGALAAPNLKTLTCYLVLASVGLLAASVSMQTGQSWAGALYYLLSTTLCTAALFLLADALEPAPPAGSAGQPVPVVHGSRLAGALFLVAALAAIGLPPLSGFIGKVMVMRSAPLPAAAVLWPGVLLSSLALLIAVSRTGTRLLWRLPQEHDPERHGAYHRVAPDGWKLGCCAFLLACSVALVLFAQPLSRYLADTAAQLFDRAAYLRAVLPAAGS
ncbi:MULTISPECIES: monovalent cation/H+ antiporter subunit D [Cupriavidus]|nr:monovalent cation/H+ antiporter subunit D [Cupriavidus sp. SK-3]KDP87347.1 cation:proton antiporter [Cupriavidus sp. SK-3]